MGIVKIVAALPIHIKAIIITCLILLSTWMIITPIYLEVLALNESIPVWGWVVVGAVMLLLVTKFGKAIL